MTQETYSNCIIMNCKNKIRHSNMCSTHLERIRVHGDPNITLLPRNRVCDVLGCNKKHFSKGFCRLHYDRKFPHIPTNESKLKKKIYDSKYYEFNKEKKSKQKKSYYLKNREDAILRSKIWSQNNRERSNNIKKRWRLKNPRSSTTYSLNVKIAMELARIRDNNTCQWHGCGKKYPEVMIDVHKIFPKFEYGEEPSYETRNLICYCRKHHALWHHYRGDKIQLFSKIIKEVIVNT